MQDTNTPAVLSAIRGERENDMEKKITIALTEKEIEALEVGTVAHKLKLEEDIERLKEHNRSGINTKHIKRKAERIEDLDALFDKLYTAEKLMQ